MLSLRTSTADRIAAAQAALTAIEQRIAQLEQQRAVALADSDEDIGAVDREIDEQRRAARAFRDRLTVLETKLAAEAEQSRRNAYEAGVAAIERALPKREKAAVEIEEAIKLLAGAVRRYEAVTSQIVAEWPTNVPKPGTNHSGYFSAYYMNCYRLDERLRRVLGAGPSLRDIVRRVSDAGGRAEGFGDSESKNSAELLAELRQRGAPRPVVDNDDEAEAA